MFLLVILGHIVWLDPSSLPSRFVVKPAQQVNIEVPKQTTQIAKSVPHLGTTARQVEQHPQHNFLVHLVRTLMNLVQVNARPAQLEDSTTTKI